MPYKTLKAQKKKVEGEINKIYRDKINHWKYVFVDVFICFLLIILARNGSGLTKSWNSYRFFFKTGYANSTTLHVV